MKRVGYSDAQSIAQDVLSRFDSSEFDVATLFYSRFENVVSQIPTAQQIIPASYDDVAADETSTFYEYEPDEGAVLANLLPRGVSTQIFAALLENGASAARP